MRYYSPLRYPGGKSSLAKYMRAMFSLNGLLDGVYVEPYAGGAAVALELVMTDYAREAWLNDVDPAVHAFWYSALHETEDLVERIMTVPLTIEEWQQQRAIHAAPTDHDKLTLGFATLYLNRTNRSGILSGGSVIGGLNQSGKWLIDARFSREPLADRVRRVGQYSHRIRLFSEDAEVFLRGLNLPERSLIYLDPPYYHKGQRLYRNHYQPDDHARIARLVQNELPYHWVVSYDDVPAISSLYSERRQIRYNLTYSAQTRRSGGELMVFSDDLRLPGAENPARYRLGACAQSAFGF
jgi:DNA adenine methylase